MNGPRIGSLCTGYGGLDQGVQSVYGGNTVWVSEIDKGANQILAHRYPNIPNLGDFTQLNWSTVSPIDILTAGFPCQPVSNAGKQRGDLDERWLWDDVARAVSELRPGIVVLENVRGLLTAGSGRLFGLVLGSLASLGYDVRWHGLRAAETGAPHNRFRVFIVATDSRGVGGREAFQHDGRSSQEDNWAVVPHESDRDALRSGPQRGLLPTPRATDGTKGGPNQRGSSGDLMLPSAVAGLSGVEDGEALASDGLAGSILPFVDLDQSAEVGDGFGAKCDGHDSTEPGVDALVNTAVPTNLQLLPTPAVNDMGAGKTVEAWDEWTAKMKAEHGNGNGHGKSLSIEAQRLLPTPMAVAFSRWGDYAEAIARWEHILDRSAPAPTMTSTKGTPQLSPVFVEWMMGLPAGWVTDVPGVTRNQALKALGNGVVPQQAAAALRIMLAWSEVAA